MDNHNQDLTELALPKRVGKYEVRGMVGQGAMGTVYRGYDADIDRLVAIKVLHPHLREDGLVVRFKHEARAAARCVHRNIVVVYDFGTHENAPYMVMEYVEGIDLRSFLNTNSNLSVQQSCDIVLQVLQALDFAHANGVVHRDIKPGNILLLDNGLVKVADFGVAKIDTSDLTNIGDMIGTPSYMSPEARVGSIVDGRADLYTVGVVLLELLCGKRPKQPMHTSAEAAELLANTTLAQSECQAFRQLFDRALSMMPDDRFQTAREFANALKAVVAPDRSYEPDTENLAATVLETRTLVRQSALSPNAPGQSPQGAQSQFTLTIEATSQLSQILSSYLGPVSSYLIKSASERCKTFDELVGNLAEKIPSQDERHQFVKRLEKTGVQTLTLAGTGSSTTGCVSSFGSAASGQVANGQSFSPGQLEQVTKDLVIYLGPVASRLVKRAAKRAQDLRQLYYLVAEHINDTKDREQFLRGK